MVLRGVFQRGASHACDVGAGSGRDALWLAELGWTVTAVEPSAAMREIALEKPHSRVHWIDDCLPELATVSAGSQRFDLILLSAVWQHLDPLQRTRAVQALCALLVPGGKLAISLRHGSDEEENKRRGFHPVSAS
ncbi:class I SAM-dependent methyltransferase [Congregibacter sp.]|uniref:class I SAM-dependent methyltransferase n=1 Tax=Congregibacter sp. TaxID=2744308 RepID=UPI003F6CEC64